MEYICPHCSEPITYVCYRADATIYGTYYIEDADHNEDSTEQEDDCTYSCPECDRSIHDPDSLEAVSDDDNNDEDEADKEDDLIKIPRPPDTDMFAVERVRFGLSGTIVPCPKCHFVYQFENGEVEITCSTCDVSIPRP